MNVTIYFKTLMIINIIKIKNFKPHISTFETTLKLKKINSWKNSVKLIIKIFFKHYVKHLKLKKKISIENY